MEQNNTNSLFIVHKVLKALAFFCILFVFMPSFLVSCSGQTIDVGLMDAIGGLKYENEYIAKPHPFFIVCILIPIGILVLMFMKQYADDFKAKVIAGAAAADILIWFYFKSAVKKMAEQYYCTVKSSGWFVLNILFLLLITGIAGMIIAKKVDMDSDIIVALTGNDANKNLKEISNKLSDIADNIKKKDEPK